MDENDALINATPFSSRYGSSVVMVLSLRLLWQYDKAASTVPLGTLRSKVHCSDCNHTSDFVSTEP